MSYVPVSEDEGDDAGAATQGPEPVATEGASRRVTFVTVRGGRFELSLDPATTIAEAKAQLERQHGLPAAGTRLIFHGRILRDTETVDGAGLRDGFVCHCLPSAPATPVGVLVRPLPQAALPSAAPVSTNARAAPGAVVAHAVYLPNAARPVAWSPWKARARVWCLALTAMFSMSAAFSVLGSSRASLLDLLVALFGVATCWSGHRAILMNHPDGVRRYAGNLVGVAVLSTALRVLEANKALSSASDAEGAEGGKPSAEAARMYVTTTVLGALLFLAACAYAVRCALRLHWDLVAMYRDAAAGPAPAAVVVQV